jgi:integrase
VHIVAARLGHSSPTITLAIYAHVLPKTDEGAALVMASVLA